MFNIHTYIIAPFHFPQEEHISYKCIAERYANVIAGLQRRISSCHLERRRGQR